MSAEPQLERSVLERKEREELQTIARALGAEPSSRAKKADLVDMILAQAGIAPAAGDTNGSATAAPEKPKRTRRASSSASSANGAETAAEATVEAAAAEPSEAAAEDTPAEPAGTGIRPPVEVGARQQRSRTALSGALQAGADEGCAPSDLVAHDVGVAGVAEQRGDARVVVVTRDLALA